MNRNFRRRLSVLKQPFARNSKQNPADSTTTLVDFLRTSKTEYLKAIQQEPGRGGEWTVVMGNESGDLDTFASSIAYAWIESKVHKRPTVPLIPIKRDDLNLRAENIYALKLAGISDPSDQLLFVTDIPQFKNPTTPFPSQRFALVDHNKIKNRYLINNPEARVVAIVDHREDEGVHKDTPDPRIVSPCGSCCSHIAISVLFRGLPSTITVPRELATLLLCAIMIDTDGLRPGGKALQIDRDAAATLIPQSTFAETVTSSLVSNINAGTMPVGNAIYDEKSMKDLTSVLSEKKNDVSHLTPYDLLRRDYKEYEYTVEWLPDKPTVRVGLSTIPIRLKAWGEEGKAEKHILSWMKERGLHIHGAITSFKKSNAKDKVIRPKDKGKGKARREQVWMVVDPTSFEQDDQSHYSPEGKKFDLAKLTQKLWERLEKDQKLKLRGHDSFTTPRALPKNVDVRVYKQGDPSRTRKYTAPLLREILTEGAPKEDPNGEQANGSPVKAKV